MEVDPPDAADAEDAPEVGFADEGGEREGVQQQKVGDRERQEERQAEEEDEESVDVLEGGELGGDGEERRDLRAWHHRHIISAPVQPHTRRLRKDNNKPRSRNCENFSMLFGGGGGGGGGVVRWVVVFGAVFPSERFGRQ